MGLWGRVAPLLTPWCSLGEVPSGVNLNRYASRGSSIPWHCDNEHLFGDHCDPKVIVCMSLGFSVDFRVCRRGRRNAPPFFLGWTMVTFWSWMVQVNHSMSIQPSPSRKGPGSTLPTGGFLSTPRPALRAGACWALPSWAGSPRVRGGIFNATIGVNAAFGVVFPLAGGRCVPRTGVRLDCPLGVALPGSQPCLSLLSHSGATCFSTRAGAMDWE